MYDNEFTLSLTTHLVRVAVSVLGAAQQPARLRAVALHAQHTVHHVLQCLGAGYLTALGHVACIV